MRAVAVFVNVHTGSVASGKSTHGNLLNADAADAPSTAVRSAKRALGAVTDSGVWQPKRAKKEKTLGIITTTHTHIHINGLTITYRVKDRRRRRQRQQQLPQHEAKHHDPEHIILDYETGFTWHMYSDSFLRQRYPFKPNRKMSGGLGD
jgi:hypothetical protein